MLLAIIEEKWWWWLKKYPPKGFPLCSICIETTLGNGYLQCTFSAGKSLVKERLEKTEIKFPEQEKCGDMIGIVWKIDETAGNHNFSMFPFFLHYLIIKHREASFWNVLFLYGNNIFQKAASYCEMLANQKIEYRFCFK